MKILFVCRGSRTQTAADILRELNKIDPSYNGVALTIYEDKWFLSLSIQDQKLFENYYGTDDIYLGIGSNKEDSNSSYSKFGYKHLEFWNHVFSERYITKLEHYERFTNPSYDRADILAYSNLCLNRFEKILLAEMPTLILDFSSLGFMRGMLHLVASEYNIPYKTFMLSRLSGYSILTDLYGHGVNEVRNEYRRLSGSNIECDQALGVIERFRREDQSVYVGHAAEKAKKDITKKKKKKYKLSRRLIKNLQFALKLLNDIRKEFILRCSSKRDLSLKYNYYLYKKVPTKYYIDSLLKKYRQRHFSRWWRKNKKSYPKDNKVRRFLFAMHVQPEASTSVAAPFFCNQELTIQNICRSLPPDGILLVKPHLQQIAVNPLDLYKRLSQIPNLYLVSPLDSIKNLIEESEAVITITGTIGLEALLLGKRSITFSETLYSVCKSVKVFNNFFDLKEYLYHGKIKAADAEDVKILVQAIINSSANVDYFILRKGQKVFGKKEYFNTIRNAALCVDSYLNSLPEL